jgi:hypothetical protein
MPMNQPDRWQMSGTSEGCLAEGQDVEGKVMASLLVAVRLCQLDNAYWCGF